MSRKMKIISTVVGIPVVTMLLMACAHIGMMKTPKPAASEFGYGPRKSTNAAYMVTVEDSAAFKTGKLLSAVIRVQAADSCDVVGLKIAVDGGMPQHGHGLPTKPRVTRDLGDGRYQVEGLKFNMGGWWELKFALTGAVNDSVVFNLAL